MDYEDKFEGEENFVFEYDPGWLKKKRKRE
jgi:hypothetical protein